MAAIRFYVGLHMAGHAQYFPRARISVNRLMARRQPLPQVADGGDCGVLIGSGAFAEISRHGRYRRSIAQYAAVIERLAGLVKVDAVVAQDMMCEPVIFQRTGLTLAEHQEITIERYDLLMALRPRVPIMPVLQGYLPDEYARHAQDYGQRLEHGAWVGVGSVCKRNTNPKGISRVLQAIHAVRPDLRLHGFDVKKTALADPAVRALLYSADSMAWFYAACRHGRDANDWREAARFRGVVEAPCPVQPWQIEMNFSRRAIPPQSRKAPTDETVGVEAIDARE